MDKFGLIRRDLGNATKTSPHPSRSSSRLLGKQAQTIFYVC